MPSPTSSSPLQGAAGIFDFFRHSRQPLFYFSTSNFNLLGAEEWAGNLRFITSVDSYDGRHPKLSTVPAPDSVPPGIEAANNFLLSHPDVAAIVGQHGPGAAAMFLMFDEQTEALAASLGLRLALPPARLRQHLDSKITTTRLSSRAGVPSVPNILAPVADYAALREAAAGLGPDLVVQLPFGDSGATTFFISSEADFLPHAARIAAQPEVKVMKRIRCRQTTIEGCVTRYGTFAGPLMTELVGFPELTPFPGGWCGNEVFPAAGSELITPAIRRQAQHAVLAMGDQLRQEGYWGCFGLDLLLDQDSGALYLGEMNPRITGASPLTTQAALDQGRPPLLLLHLLEWMGVEFNLDVDDFNHHWLHAGAAVPWSQMIIEHISGDGATMTAAPPSGIWRLDPGAPPRYLRPAFGTATVDGDAEAFFMRTVDAGRTIGNGSSIGRLILRGRLMDDDYRLTPRATAWIDGFRQIFAGAAS